MKILAINSSFRGEHGLTQILLERMKTGAVSAGAEFETVILTQYKINQCLGCEVCHTEKSYLKCVYEDKDDVKAIFQKMREADLLIYATPIYIFNMSGLLKRLMERINSTGDVNQLQVSKKGLFFHHIDKDLCSKPFALLTTCGNIEDETSQSVINYFKTYANFMDAPQVGVITRKAGFQLYRKTEQELPGKAEVLDAFREAGRDLALYGRITKKHQKQASRNVIQMPPPISLLMKFKPLRAKLVAEGMKRGIIQFK